MFPVNNWLDGTITTALSFKLKVVAEALFIVDKSGENAGATPIICSEHSLLV
jgi:hypothetical protein